MPVGIPDGPNGALPGNPLNQDRAKFNVSAFDRSNGTHWIYYSSQNSRILLDVQQTNGAWLYNPARVALQMPAGSTVGLGTVLANANPTYRNALDGQLYTNVMYFVYQNSAAQNAGSTCVSFSNDGLSWSTPINVVLASAPATLCTSGGGVLTESIGAFHRTGSEIDLFGLEGNLSLLQQYANQQRTLTYFFKASVTSPNVLQTIGEISGAGLFNPNIPGGTADYYFRNLDVTYDPVSGILYLFRVTPYPYSLSPINGGNVPCSGVCPQGLDLPRWLALQRRNQPAVGDRCPPAVCSICD